MRISVAICTRDRPERLSAALESLARLEPPGVAWETLVVDNGGRTPAADVARPFDELLNLRSEVEPEAGLSHARNRCLRIARGELIVFIDDDVTVPSGWLRAYADAFARHPEAGAFGGPIVAELDGGGHEAALRAVREVMPGVLSEHDPGLPAGPIPFGDPTLPWGANMAFRRSALAGREFDVRLGRRPGRAVESGEETWLLKAVVSDGYPVVWVPEAALRHHITADRLRPSYFRRFCEGVGWSIGFEKAQEGREDPAGTLAELEAAWRERRRQLRRTPPWAPRERRWLALREAAVFEGLCKGFRETAAALDDERA